MLRRNWRKKLSKNRKIPHFSKSGGQIFTIFWHMAGGLPWVRLAQFKKIVGGNSSYGPDKKISLFGGYPQIVTSEVRETEGVNVPRWSPEYGTEISFISAETAEIFEVNRKLWSPLVVTYEVIKWGTTHSAREGHGVYRNMEVLRRYDVTGAR